MRARFFRHDPDVGRMHRLIADSWRARGALNTFHVRDLHWRLPAGDNTAALALYEACGFRVFSTDWDWERKLA